MGIPVRVTPERGVPHQDAGAISLVSTATLDWCAQHLGVDADPRRLRVNIVIASHQPCIKESWLGRSIQLGGSTLRVTAHAERCRMIDIPQDGVTPACRWLKPLAAHRGTKLAVYADVSAPGSLRIGDTLSA